MRRLGAGTALLAALIIATGLPGGASWSTRGDPTRVVGQPVTPEGATAQAGDQATDRQGDTAYFFALEPNPPGTLNLRIRLADGTLLPSAQVADLAGRTWVAPRIAVDRDGDGIVAWVQGPVTGEINEIVFARRFTRDGVLGPLLQISPPEQDAGMAHVVVQPSGTALVSWSALTGASSRPYVRTVAADGTLGEVSQVGPGPNAGAPLMVVSHAGRATLVWTDERVFARHVSPAGQLLPRHRVRNEAYPHEALDFTDVGIDRRGIVVAVGMLRTRDTSSYPQPDNSRHLPAWIRVSPKLRMLGRVRVIDPRRVTVDDSATVAVAPSGYAIIGWQDNYYDGAWVRPVNTNGSMGRPRLLGDGGMGDIALVGDGDGVVATSARGDTGYVAHVYATIVRNGRIGSTRLVGASDWDIRYLRAAHTGSGGSLVSWAESLDGARIMTAALGGG